MLETITIVGLGAMGILFGDLAVRNLGPDKVRFLASGDRLARYQRDGAWCNDIKCDFRFSDGSDGPAQLLVFAVKAPDLEDAIALAAPVVDGDTVIISLLNGVTSEEILEQAFGPEKVLYTVTQGMDAVREGNRLTYHTPGQMFLGIPQEDYYDRAEYLAVMDSLHPRGIPSMRQDGLAHRRTEVDLFAGAVLQMAVEADPFAQTLGGDGAVHFLKLNNTLLDGIASEEDAEGEDASPAYVVNCFSFHSIFVVWLFDLVSYVS